MKESFWKKNINGLPDEEKRRIIELGWINLAGFAISSVVLIFKAVSRNDILCLPCDVGNVFLFFIALVCLYNGRRTYALNLTFIIPAQIYGYYLSNFHDHLPESETLYHTLWWLIIGIVYLAAFSAEIRRFYYFSLLAFAVMFYHISQSGRQDDLFSVNQVFIKNPLLILLLVFISTLVIRSIFEKKMVELKNIISQKDRKANELIKNWKQPIIFIEAQTDDEGDITDHIITRANPAFETHFQIKNQDVAGQKVNFVFGYLFKNIINTTELFITNTRPQSEYWFEHLDKWYTLTTVQPGKNQFICIFNDTTAYNKLVISLRESRQRYKVLLEAIPDIFFVIDKDGIYEDFVIKESDKLKINNAEIIGNSIYEVGFSEKMANKIYQCIQDAIVNDSIESIEYALDTPNGTFMFEMRLAKLSNNSVISVARDITKRKTAEFQLEVAKKEAEEANRLKSAFLANLSHEIRTPMSAILGSSEILADPDLPDDEKEVYANAIVTNGHELMKMIDDTINLSKIETNTVDIKMSFCLINSIMRELQNLYEPIADTNDSLDFVMSVGVQNPKFGFVTDRYLLLESMSKLIDNAIKFTESGKVKFGYMMVSPMFIEFYVEDTGKGIHVADLEKIYDRYYKVERINTLTNRGSGLGLSIAKEFVSLLGGQLSAESVPGKGSRFSFTLPFKNGEGYLKLVK